jgi:hypothetical protein
VTLGKLDAGRKSSDSGFSPTSRCRVPKLL